MQKDEEEVGIDCSAAVFVRLEWAYTDPTVVKKNKKSKDQLIPDGCVIFFQSNYGA